VTVNLTESAKRTTVVHSRTEGDAQTDKSGPDAGTAVRDRCRLDEETGRRPDARAGGGKIDPWFSFKSAAHHWAAANRWWTSAAKARPCCHSCRNLNQLGQTGSTPRPCEGIEHLLPRRGTAHRRLAIHQRTPRHQLDPNCGLGGGQSDVLYVADAFAVMGKVNELLSTAK